MPQSWAPGLPQLLAAPTDSQQPALPPPASVQLSLRPHHRSDGAAPHRTHAAVVPVQCTQSYATVVRRNETTHHSVIEGHWGSLRVLRSRLWSRTRPVRRIGADPRGTAAASAGAEEAGEQRSLAARL